MSSYYVLAPSGDKYGPATADILTQWASEGRLAPDSWVEDAMTGRRLLARDVPGIILLGTPQPMTPPYQSGGGHNPGPHGGPQFGGQPYNSGYSSPPGSSSPYVRPSQYGSQPYSPETDKFVTISWVCFGLSLVCCGFIASIVGIIYANKALEVGHPMANAPRVANIIILVLSLLLLPFAILTSSI